MIVDDDTSVHREITVPLGPDRAFALFTERMHTWWPQSHSIGTAPRADVVLEPHAGGRWFERGDDGSECAWGRVAAWEPPHRLVLIWQISARWRHDPDLETEVEVTFTEQPTDAAHGTPGTRVDLVHRGLEAFGDDAATMREVFRSPGGWPGILAGLEAVART